MLNGRLIGSLLILCLSLGFIVNRADGYPLSDDERARLKAAIPRTFDRLENRKPVHVVLLGDSITRVTTLGENPNQTILGLHAQFATRLATEFFYPGGARVTNPLEDEPIKRDTTVGPEIFLENFGAGGHCAVDALQHITTDAFLHDPDLVMICYGVNDALQDIGLGTYRIALENCIDVCRARGVDVILLGPSLIRQSPGPTGWGLTRAHATRAREIAEAKGVFFVDLGKGLSRRGGIPFKEDPQEGIEMYSERLASIFKLGPEVQVEDWMHPNHTAHRTMGDQIYDELMDGEQADALKMSGRAIFDGDGKVQVTLLLQNTGDKRRRGQLAALTMRRMLTPEDPSQSFDLQPGQSRTFNLVYSQVPEPGQEALAVVDNFYPLDADDSTVRLSYLVADEQQSRIMDVVTPLEPVGVEWGTTLLTGVTNALRLDWRFLNGGDKAVNGRYQVELDGKRVDGQFSLDQGQAKRFYAEFVFAPRSNVVRQKMEASITLDIGGRIFKFTRELEATRDLFLGEKVALSNLDDYLASGLGVDELAAGKPGVTLRADADEKNLYLTFDFEEVPLLKIPAGASLIADVSIDGRPADEVRKVGCVGRVRFTTSDTDGYGTTEHMRPGFFGNGYAKRVDERNVISTVKTRSDMGRRVLVRIPRVYLFRHEWDLGNADSVLGINAVLSLVALDPQTGAPSFPGSHRYLLAKSGYYAHDARSLVTLRLTQEKTPTWSVRLY